MWQFRVEIEYYSIAYFDHITMFKALYCRTSVKSGTLKCYVNLISIHEFTQCV